MSQTAKIKVFVFNPASEDPEAIVLRKSRRLLLWLTVS